MPDAVVAYTPLPVHVPFHRSKAKYRCLIGGLGSGKSLALCAESIAHALEQPGSNILLCRRYGPDLKDTTERNWFALLPEGVRDSGHIQRGGGRVQDFTFHNGSHVRFRGLDDWTRHKSAEYSFIGIDEADEQSEENLNGISGRLRQTAPLPAAAEAGYATALPMRRQIVLASNPAGKNWLYRRFIDPATKAPGGEGFVSTSLDNAYLPLDYVEDLLSRDLSWIRRWVLCEFDELAGAIYPSWGAKHVVAFRPPAEGGLEIWQGFDPGSTRVNPSAALWVAVDRPRARLVGLAEYVGHDMSAAQHAAAWRSIEAKLPGRVTYRVADPAAIGARDRGSNMTLLDIYRRNGFTFQPARSNNPDVRIPALGELIALNRFVVTPACPVTNEHITGYSREDQLPSQLEVGPYRDKVKKKNDHLVDAAQYLSLRWVMAHRAVAEEQGTATDHELWSSHVKSVIHAQIKRPPARQDGVVT